MEENQIEISAGYRPTGLFVTFLCVSALQLAALANSADGVVTNEVSQDRKSDAENSVTDYNLLVRQLGDKSFAVRARASRLLTEVGSPAIKALEAGRISRNREVRQRSLRILNVVTKRDLERRLNQFVLDRQSDQGLSGWDAFRNLVGDSGDSRAIFVSMHRLEPTVMRALNGAEGEATKAVVKRLQAIRGQSRFNYNDVPLGTIAAMFFVSAGEGVEIPSQMASTIGGLANYKAFQEGMRSQGQRPVLRGLLRRWTRAGVEPSYGFSFAMRYDLPEGLELAKQLLADRSPQKPHIRQMAILTLTKLGSTDHIPLLEKLLNDEQHVTGSTTRNRIQYRTQIRDVALASIISLKAQDHRKLGFTRISFSTDRLFRTSSIGFANEEQRKKVFDNWKYLKETGKYPELKPSPNQPTTNKSVSKGRAQTESAPSSTKSPTPVPIKKK